MSQTQSWTYTRPLSSWSPRPGGTQTRKQEKVMQSPRAGAGAVPCSEAAFPRGKPWDKNLSSQFIWELNPGSTSWGWRNEIEKGRSPHTVRGCEHLGSTPPASGDCVVPAPGCPVKKQIAGCLPPSLIHHLWRAAHDPQHHQLAQCSGHAKVLGQRSRCESECRPLARWGAQEGFLEVLVRKHKLVR